ncbi:hypothetical protein NMS_1293 [Nonlabens marinus S1-08]|uniref:Uncharacterized protein n=1 Tax=Nonlabens marinus S1-08 TaxID=1454201 RepID=W8VX48_9FLAO|nr:hypothetical protein NMS_1293 [Nonlabens marinus S1-08]
MLLSSLSRKRNINHHFKRKGSIATRLISFSFINQPSNE